MSHPDSFGARHTVDLAGQALEIFRLDALQPRFDVARLPYSLKVLLENLLRNEDGKAVTVEDIEALASWDPQREPTQEIAYTPSRVLMQDFTGVPAIVDLAAMRDAMAQLGGDPKLINPLVPVELVIDHSIQVDVFGERFAFRRNAELEFERNRERYAFLRWARAPSTTSPWCRRTRGSATRSTSSTSRTSCTPATARRSRTRWWEPTLTRR